MLAVKGHDSQFQPLDWKGSRVSFSFSKELSKFASPGSKTRNPFHQHLRSLITTNQGKPIDGISFCQISELRLLKVLDLSSHRVDGLSSATFKPLNHLKYLVVWASRFYFHPESHLPNIETFIVKIDANLVVLPVSFWEMKKLRHVEIPDAYFDKQGMFEGSFKLENLRILRNVRFSLDKADWVDVLLRRCPNLQQLHILFWDRYSADPICLTLENLTKLQILRLSFKWRYIVSGLQLPSNLKKLVLKDVHTESIIPFIAGLQSLEYLQLKGNEYHSSQSEEWCLGDITFHKLKLLKLSHFGISRWDASEESFPLLETLVVKGCYKLEEIPLSFADIPTLKQIKLMYCNNTLEASAVRIKKEVEEIEGCDRIDITTRDRSGNIRKL